MNTAEERAVDIRIFVFTKQIFFLISVVSIGIKLCKYIYFLNFVNILILNMHCKYEVSELLYYKCESNLFRIKIKFNFGEKL